MVGESVVLDLINNKESYLISGNLCWWGEASRLIGC